VIDRPLFAHTWRMQRVKLAVVCLGLIVWGFVTPVVYAQFGAQFRMLLENGLIPEQFVQFGGGDIFSLPGAIALGFIHPISLILNSVFAVGYTTAAIASERQRGTLEVTLSRPISRHTLYRTLFAASFRLRQPQHCLQVVLPARRSKVCAASYHWSRCHSSG
jgi:putative exporter of polyketide antibiotics